MLENRPDLTQDILEPMLNIWHGLGSNIHFMEDVIDRKPLGIDLCGDYKSNKIIKNQCKRNVLFEIKVR
jgi:hypothetical protein